MTRRARAKRDALATTHLDLVVNIAERIRAGLPDSFCLADLIGEGNVALLRAAARYDPATHGGTPFSAFARKMIRGAILDSVGRRVAGNGHSLNKYMANTCVSIDERPNRPLNLGDLSPWITDAPRTEAELALARMAHQPTAPGAIDRARRNRRVSEAMSWLPERERTILSLTYADEEPHPRLIARLMGLSLDEANRIHDSAIAHLRARLNGGALPKAA